MLSAVLKRSTFAAKKVLDSAGPPQRCFSSLLASGGSGSLQICHPSSVSEHSDRRRKCHTFIHYKMPERLQLSQKCVRIQHFHSSVVRLKKRTKLEPPPRELDLLRYDMKELWKSPKPALVLGFGGLIPFVAPTLFMAVTETYFAELAYTQLAYAASIVSFLGGARWGFTLPESSPAKPDWINLANSVVPSLFAWMTMLMSDSIIAASITVIMALGISLHYDLALLPTYPSWFKALRAVLTTVAFFSLVGMLIINGIYPEKKIFSE